MVNYELISVRMGVGGLWHNKTVKYEIRVATKILRRFLGGEESIIEG